MQRHDGITRFFAYEFAVVPMPCSKTMMCKLSKSALAKALDQRQTKDASKPDASFSIESENEFGKDKENDSDVEENIFEILEDTGINKKDTTSDTSNINYIVDGVVIFYIVV